MAAWNALKEGVGSVPEFFSGNLGQPASLIMQLQTGALEMTGKI